jgi:hypothetical protein
MSLIREKNGLLLYGVAQSVGRQRSPNACPVIKTKETRGAEHRMRVRHK